MSTTLAGLREGVSKLNNDWWEGTTTSAGTTTTLVDTSIVDRPITPHAGEFAILSSGDYAGESRKVESFDDTTTTVNRAFTATGNGVTYELHRVDPDAYTEALNWARIDAYPHVCQVLDNTTIYTQENVSRYTIPSSIADVRQVYLCDFIGATINENLLDNGDFENFTSDAPDDWDSPTNITTAEEDDTDFIMKGSYCCKCTSTTSAGSLYQTVSSASDYAGKRVSLQVHVYCRTATRVKAAIYDSSATSSSYHGGNGWEWLEVSYNMPASPSALKAGVTTASGAAAITFYIDEAILTINDEYVSKPGELITRWEQRGTTLEFPEKPTAFKPIRLVGTGYCSSVAEETDTMEVDAPQTDVLYAGALTYVYRQQLSASGASNLPATRDKLYEWEGTYLRWKRSKGMVLPARIQDRK